MFSLTSLAETCIFTAMFANWNVAGNWSCGHVPNDGDDVIIGDGTNNRTVRITDTDLGVDETFNGNITITNSANVLIGDIITINGTITVENGGRLQFFNDVAAEAEKPQLLMDASSIINLKSGGLFNSNSSSSDFGGTTITIGGTVVYNSSTDPEVINGPQTYPEGALPVQLISFTGISTDQVNELHWSTSAEFNSDYFELQKYVGGAFKTLGIIPSEGFSSEVVDYNFTDYNPLHPVSIYRLLQFDFDGAKDNLGIIYVESINPNGLVIYPNPVSNNLFRVVVPSIHGKPIDFAIQSLVGDTFKKISLAPGTHSIDTTNWPKGIYIIRSLSTIFRSNHRIIIL